MVPSNAQLVTDGPDEWAMILPGYPIAGSGSSKTEAIADTIDALHEYAHDWQMRLKNAPNHRDSAGLVDLVSRSSDAELQRWLTADD